MDLCFFFFQAEDGIRDHCVTGVQTCALPIFAVGLQRRGRTGAQAKELLQQIGDVLLTQHRMVGRVEVEEKPDVLWDHPEIGRASCRERVEIWVVEVAVKEKTRDKETGGKREW